MATLEICGSACIQCYMDISNPVFDIFLACVKILAFSDLSSYNSVHQPTNANSNRGSSPQRHTPRSVNSDVHEGQDNDGDVSTRGSSANAHILESRPQSTRTLTVVAHDGVSYDLPVSEDFVPETADPGACPLSDQTLYGSYESESPDELSLVKAACQQGCKLLQRGVDFVLLWLPSTLIQSI